MPPTRADHPDHARLSLANARPEIDRAEEALLACMDRHAYTDAAKFAVRLALEEGIVNAFCHGHKDLTEPRPVELTYDVHRAHIEITITDQGPGYNPSAIPDPTLDENIEKTSGRGLMLIRSFMTEVRHELDGRRLVMVYRQPS